MQATEEDYEQVPIEQFGLAVLRGMGWKDGDGIGKTGRYLFTCRLFFQLWAAFDVFHFCYYAVLSRGLH